MARPATSKTLSWTCAVPVLCALHCAAAPLLVGLLPVLALSSTVEWVLMGASMVLATVVAVAGVRAHREWRIVGVMALGFVVWILSLAGVFAPIREVATTIVGSLIVAAGLFWNARRSVRVRGQACGCPGCGEAEETRSSGPEANPVLRGGSASARSG
jgi:energy-coupling factor transporter transmembrane protein EcfT